MKHLFDVEIAEQYGVNAAILLENLGFWILKNKVSDDNYHDGYYWTYNSYRSFHELFPYMSERQIATALKKLADEGLIITGNYNKNPFNRSIWYALTREGEEVLGFAPLIRDVVSEEIEQSENCMEHNMDTDFTKPCHEVLTTSNINILRTDINNQIYIKEKLPYGSKEKSKSDLPLSVDEMVCEVENDERIPDAVKEALKDWISYKAVERKDKYQPTGFASLLTSAAKNTAEYGETAVIDTITESIGNLWQGINWKGIKKRRPVPAYIPEDSFAYKSAAFLDKKLRKRMPTLPAKSAEELQKWAAAFNDCHNDGHDWDEIADVLAWAIKDEFWQNFILDPYSFRRKYVRLLSAMTQEGE